LGKLNKKAKNGKKREKKIEKKKLGDIFPQKGEKPQ